MNTIEKNPKFNDLRVRIVAEAGTPLVETHPNHPARKVTEDIPPNPDFNGLPVRVLAPAGTPLVETHPSRPDRKATAEIPPSEAHGGLRVKTIKLADHAREALSALGGPKSEDAASKCHLSKGVDQV
jgi:hypothetical protein